MSRRGINVAMVMGNVGTDPEVRYAPSGSAIANLSIATSESWKDKQSGEMQERTEWHRVVFYNKLAEIVGQYVKKGSRVFVQGAIKTRKWQDQSGADRYTTEIIASEMQMMDKKGEVEAMTGGGYSNSKSSGYESSSKQDPIAANAGPLVDDIEDDIPF